MKNHTRHKESGLDTHLRESMENDSEFREMFLAEAEKLPAASRRRMRRDLPMAGPVAKYHALAEAPQK
jgi:hypothetical protein